MAVNMPNQHAGTAAKVVVDKWFYTYGIPAIIDTDQREIFNNKIIQQLCKLYSSEQATTTSHNPQGNSVCEKFTLHNLLKPLGKAQKPNHPVHLSILVFAYYVMLHSTTRYQLYQLMFCHKTQVPCGNWLAFS